MDVLLQILFCTTPKIVAKIEFPSTQLNAVCLYGSQKRTQKDIFSLRVQFYITYEKILPHHKEKSIHNYAHLAVIKNNNLKALLILHLQQFVV